MIHSKAKLFRFYHDKERKRNSVATFSDGLILGGRIKMFTCDIIKAHSFARNFNDCELSFICTQ